MFSINEIQKVWFPEGPDIKCFVIFNLSYSKNKETKTAYGKQLYPGRDTFEFDQGHVTKNQPITVLILASESLAI